jgi:hypothetical protein
MIKRSILGPPRVSRLISPGVHFEALAPGGKDGPNDEVHNDYPGGQSWSDLVYLGRKDEGFQLSIPDIRLPPNQFWPLHWHDCWIAVVVLEGSCLVGDWWMTAGDVAITAAGLEYGPLLIGPRGCRMFEIFAQHHLQVGGFAPEFRDHPTLIGSSPRILERSAVNRRNEGRQSLPMAGVEGIFIGRLNPEAQWDLGEPDDPERGILKSTHLAPGAQLGPASYADWHAIIVLNGSVGIGEDRLVRDDLLLIEPDSPVGPIVAGSDGAELLQVARTATAIVPRPVG